jgi:hypothetical protein
VQLIRRSSKGAFSQRMVKRLWLESLNGWEKIWEIKPQGINPRNQFIAVIKSLQD